MSVSSDPPSRAAGFGVSPEDYDQVAAAVMESARGRWFLEEFARRNRASDTEIVLRALAEMQDRLTAASSAPAGVQGAVEAAALIERAATRGALLRRLLDEVNGGNRRLGRAMRLTAEIEQALAAALKSLGVPVSAPTTEAPNVFALASAPEPEEPRAAEPPAAAEPPVAFPPLELAAAPAEPEPAAASAEPQTPVTEAVPLPDTPRPDLPRPDLPRPDMPRPARPGGLPPAWTPGLLETMSEEDRARLFA